MFSKTATVAASLGLMAGAPAGEAAAPLGSYTLKLDQPVFLDGVRGVYTPTPAYDWAQGEAGCEQGFTPCWEATLDVPAGAARLRVAIDNRWDLDAGDGNSYALRMISPSGQASRHGGALSAEAFIDDPEAGRWKAVVIAFRASGGPRSGFRLRSRAESPEGQARAARALSKNATQEGALLPNLRMLPPYEFTLETPGTLLPASLSFYDVDQARGVAPTDGCLPSEIVDYGARRCLRFSFGPENVGAGRLELRLRPDSEEVGSAPMWQQIQQDDGTFVERRAGRVDYHPEHAHFHVNAFSAQAFRVVDLDRGQLEPVGDGFKQGFCPEDMRIANWGSFANESDAALTQDCEAMGPKHVPSGQEMRLGIGRGWADVYLYSYERSYVDLGDGGDGLFVVGVGTNLDSDDAGYSIAESDARDNQSYALVRVSGDRVELLERGYGSDPWDPAKVVIDDPLLPATADE